MSQGFSGEFFTKGLAVPSGVLCQYAGATAPPGWLICDGTAVNRTTYAALFAAISTTFGVGDGSTTFNLPDLRDKFSRGKSGTVALGATGGATSYSHSGTAVSAHSTSNNFEAFSSSSITGVTTATHSVTQPTAHSSVEPPYLSLNFIVKI
jgi:microcystin-dependent protein